MAEFSNRPLTEIPELCDDNFVKVEPNLLRASLVGMGLFGAVVVVAVLVWVLAVDGMPRYPLITGAAVLLSVLIAALLRVLEVRHMGYQLREHDLSVRRGVLIRTVSTVPFVRVQHARLHHGPFQRFFGLATLEVNSAGPDLRLPGLSMDDAERMKLFLVERAGALVEDA